MQCWPAAGEWRARARRARARRVAGVRLSERQGGKPGCLVSACWCATHLHGEEEAHQEVLKRELLRELLRELQRQLRGHLAVRQGHGREDHHERHGSVSRVSAASPKLLKLP